MSKSKKRSPEKSSSKKEVSVMGVSIQRVGIAAATGLLVLLVSVFALAALTASGTLPAGYIRIYAGAAVFLGGLICALVAGGSKRKLLSALVAAILLLAVLLLIGTAAFSGQFATENFLMVLIILLISCMIGSVISTAIH